MPGFSSTRVESANINLGDFQQNKVVKMPDLVLSPRDSGGANQTVLIP